MNGTIRYTIRPYDTFWMLAQVFNTTAESIMELNPGVDPRNLQIGHVITIRPGFQYDPSYPTNNNMMGNMPNYRMPGNGMMNGGMMNDGMMNDDMMNDGIMNGGMMNGGMMNGGMMNDGMMNDDMMDEESEMLADLMQYFRLLWVEHVMWTRMVILGIIFDLPELEFSTQRLLRNANDFANALAPFYGDEAAQTFENLFQQHITIAAELVNAAKAGDTNQVDAIWQRWVDNGNQIADFLGSINPNWNSEDWSAMMMEHLELLGDNVTDLLEQKYQESIEGFDEIVLQAMEMADMMAEGIASQFPA